MEMKEKRQKHLMQRGIFRKILYQFVLSLDTCNVCLQRSTRVVDIWTRVSFLEVN